MFTETSPKAASPVRERVVSEPLRSLAALEGVAAEWHALWARSGARPFQSPAWLLPWMRYVGCGEVASVAVRRAADGRLVGLAPLYVYEDAQGVRHLFPLGIATTDYLDVLCEPGREDDVLAAISAHIVPRRGDWDVFEAPQLDAGSLLLRCPKPHASRREVSACEPHPVVPLDRPLPHGFAKRLGTAQRRIAREGRVAYEWAAPARVDALLAELARLHESRWATRAQPGVLRGDGVMEWHRECAARLAAQGLLRLVALKFEGRVIGVVYAIADAPQLARRRWYSYIGGFDPQFSTYSPGKLLIGAAIERARSEGAAYFDFLRGAEPYKYLWGAVDQPMFALRLSV